MDTSKFTDGAQLFRAVGRMDGGVRNAEIRSGKYYRSSVLEVHASGKIIKNGPFCSHHLGPSRRSYPYVNALKLRSGQLFRRLTC